MKQLKHLPIKRISVTDKKGRTYIRNQHYNPNKDKNQQKSKKVDKFLKLEKEIGEKVKAFAELVKEYISPEEFKKELNEHTLDKLDPIIQKILQHIAGSAYINFDEEPMFQFDGRTIYHASPDIEFHRYLYLNGSGKVEVSNELIRKSPVSEEKDIAEKMLLTQATFLEEYFGKGEYIIVTHAMTSDSEIEPYIGAGIWYYKGMDIVSFPTGKEIVKVMNALNQRSKYLKFESASDEEKPLHQLMLGKFTYNKKDINQVDVMRLKLFFQKIFNLSNRAIDKVVKNLLDNKELSMREFLKYYSTSYVSIINDREKFISNYIRRNRNG